MCEKQNERQKNLSNALQDFRKSGYQVDITLHDENLLPIKLKIEDDRILFEYQDRVIFTVTATKTVDGAGKFVIHLDEKEMDLTDRLMSEARETMLDELL